MIKRGLNEFLQHLKDLKRKKLTLKLNERPETLSLAFQYPANLGFGVFTILPI